MNAVLKSLFDCDMADHNEPCIAGTDQYIALRKRDSERRDEVRRILNQRDVLTPLDLYHAAWILNHGDDEADAKLAFELADQSVAAGHEPAKWLFAAAYDRWRMYRGEPQKFGTQIVPDGQRYRVWDTEPDTTDQERAQFNVPSLDKMHARAASESENMDQPPMEFAPKWLQDAIARWQRERDV